MLCIATEETSQVLAERERERFVAEKNELVRLLEAERANLAAIIDTAPAFIATLRGPEHVVELATDMVQSRLHAQDREAQVRHLADAMPQIVCVSERSAKAATETSQRSH
jgi:hypothetical protein